MGDAPRLVFIFDLWHPQLRTDEQRLHALRGDAVGTERYLTARQAMRAGVGLPSEPDLVADRRVRTVY